MTRFSVLVASVSCLLFAGCAAPDNVATCEDWVTTVSCGDSFDVGTMVDCDVYANTTCDIADYFTCLSDNFACDETTDPWTADTSAWADCAPQATCE